MVNQGLPSVDIGRKLHADYVLEGDVTKAADGYGFDIRLIRVTDQLALWGEHYDSLQAGLVPFQHDVATKVANALKIQMSVVDQEKIYRRYTDNQQAYLLYLKGRRLLVQHSDEGIRAAAQAFKDALALDNNNALAHAGLAMASAEMPARFARISEVKSWKDIAVDEAHRALQEDANLAEAHQALAAVARKSEYDWDQTIREGRRALELNPNLDQPHYYIAGAYYHLGLLDLVDKEVDAGLQAGGDSEANPEDRAEAERNKGVAALLGGDFVNAVAQLEEVRGLRRNPQSDLWLARAYYHLGKKVEGEKMLKELTSSSSASTASRSKATLAGFLAADGDRAEAQRLLTDVLASHYMDHHVAHSLSDACAQLRNNQQALHWLRVAADTGFPCYPWYAKDPLLDPLRSNPEFQSFLAEEKSRCELARKRYSH
jgi:tetratricopeptide (TPR) repeat protein